MNREQVAETFLALRNIPFRHQGRSVQGVDCVGLLAVGLERLGYPTVDVIGYRCSPSATVIRDTLKQNFDEIPIDEVGLGDIYLMRIGGIKPKHASVVVNTKTDIVKGIVPQIIHAYGVGGTGRVVVEPLSQWRAKCVVGFRLRGLEV